MQLTDAPFDRARVLENLGGDEALLGEIAELFVAAWPESLARLRAALASADAVELRGAAHALKGSVANFGAERAVQAAKRLEITCQAGDLARAPAQLDEVVAAVDEVVAALGAEIGQILKPCVGSVPPCSHPDPARTQ